MGDYSRYVTTHHEAGHAIMAAVLGKPIEYVDIQPDDGSPPVTCYQTEPPIETETPDERARELIVREIKIALAGITAQNRFTGYRLNVVGGFDDWKTAVEWAAHLAGDEGALRLAQQVHGEVEGFFSDPNNWYAVECLAALLIRNCPVDGEQVSEIISSIISSGLTGSGLTGETT